MNAYLWTILNFKDQFKGEMNFLPAHVPRVGWCTWPGAPASQHLDSAFSETSSPKPPAAGP